VVQGTIAVTSSSILTIDPGVTVEMDTDAHLRTYGGCSIVAIGTYDDPILFTSSSVTPAANDWYAVYLRESPASGFSYCTFEYGVYNLYADLCSATVSYCTSRYADNGFVCESGSLLLEGCDIIDNNRGIKIYGPDSYPVLHNCNIYNNYYDNMYVASYTEAPLVTIDAENNWWGTDVDSEIEATISFSNSAYAEVDYTPWLHEIPVEAISWGRVKALFAD
jgi:parallel beta-helix repeat protein